MLRQLQRFQHRLSSLSFSSLQTPEIRRSGDCISKIALLGHETNWRELTILIKNSSLDSIATDCVKQIVSNRGNASQEEGLAAYNTLLEWSLHTNSRGIPKLLNLSHSDWKIAEKVGVSNLAKAVKQFKGELGMKIFTSHFSRWLLRMPSDVRQQNLSQLFSLPPDYFIGAHDPIQNATVLLEDLVFAGKNNTGKLKETIGDILLATILLLKEKGKLKEGINFLNQFFLASDLRESVRIPQDRFLEIFSKYLPEKGKESSEFLDAMILLCQGRHIESVYLRERFLGMLLARGRSDLIVEYGSKMVEDERFRPSGTRFFNSLIAARASRGEVEEAMFLLNRSKEEALAEARSEPSPSTLPSSVELQVGRGEERNAPFLGTKTFSFGLNVHSYISFLTSLPPKDMSVQSAAEASTRAEVAKTLLRRMISDGVVPDARFLLHLGHIGREAKDYLLVMKTIEFTHMSCQVSKRPLKGDFFEQPPTSIRSRLSDNSDKHGVPSSVEYSRKGLFVTPDEMSQLYHYGIDTARKLHKPDDCLTMLNALIGMHTQVETHTLKNVMGCMLESERYEEVLRIFEAMPGWGVERDRRHASIFVEALSRLGRLSDAWRGLRHMAEVGQPLMLPAYRALFARLLFSLMRTRKYIDAGRVKLSTEETVEAVVSVALHIAKEQQRGAAAEMDSNKLTLTTELTKFGRRADPTLVEKIFELLEEAVDREAAANKLGSVELAGNSVVREVVCAVRENLKQPQHF